MKKTIKLKKLNSNKNPRIERFLPNKRISNSLLQPKKAKCFQRQTNFYIKFVIPRQEYSQKTIEIIEPGKRKNKRFAIIA